MQGKGKRRRDVGRLHMGSLDQSLAYDSSLSVFAELSLILFLLFPNLRS